VEVILVVDARDGLCSFLRLIQSYFKPAQLICPLTANQRQIAI
jgi:hypothetical protein